MTIEELHASMLAHGIKPEDNILSRELLRMRYGDDYDQDEYMRNLTSRIRKSRSCLRCYGIPAPFKTVRA